MNIEHPTASELVRGHQIELGDEARQHLQSALYPANWTPAAYLDRLLEHKLPRDARHFLAHALPRRRALWWACLCARDVREFVAEAGLSHMLDVAVQFVRSPAESTRREAERVMKRHPSNSFTSQLAAAVFLSHGSMAPLGEAPIAVPPQVLGRLVSTVVYLAATKKNVVQYVHHMREYIALGQQIAAGKYLWPQAETESEFVYRFDLEHIVAAEEHQRQAHSCVHCGSQSQLAETEASRA